MNATEFHKISANAEAKAKRWADYLRRLWAGMENDPDGPTLAQTMRDMSPEGWEHIRKWMGERTVPNLSKARLLELLEDENVA